MTHETLKALAATARRNAAVADPARRLAERLFPVVTKLAERTNVSL